MTRHHLNRRAFLRAVGIAFTLVAFGRPFASATGRASSPFRCVLDGFSSGEHALSVAEAPSTKTAAQDGAYDRIVKGRVRGFTVPRGETWRVKGLVKSTKNVIVKGTLVMDPATRSDSST